MERRQAARFAINLPCYIKLGSNGSIILAGLTENISRIGMTLRISAAGIAPEALPLAGDHCDIYLELPQHPRTAKRCLHCRAAVAWTRQIHPSEMQLGLSVGSMTFRDFPSGCDTGVDEENEQPLLM